MSSVSIDGYDFGKCIQLFKEHQWLYDFKVTEYLIQEIWNQIPSDRVCFENAPSSLKEFISTCHQLSLLHSKSNAASEIDLSSRAKFSAKKRHEVEKMSSLLSSLCQKHDCSRIVDIGCGMAYLSQILMEQFGLSVVGVDCEAACCAGAQRKHGTKAVDVNILEINESSESEQKMLELIGDERTALVSLHGCGDLQPIILKFLAKHKPPNVPFAVTVGCCYHKMSQKFFPMSSALRKVTLQDFLMSKYGFRLAAQQPAAVWVKQTEEQHRDHVKNVSFRAALEHAVFANGWTLNKQKRHLIRPVDCLNLESFVGAVLQRTQINASDNEVRKEIERSYNKHRQFCTFIEPITALQTLLQNVLESLIYADRCAFLNENSYNATIVPVFDAVVSPRNNAIVIEQCKSS